MLTNNKSILLYFHCKQCLEEKPADLSPAEFTAFEVGWTGVGLQVWCRRHDINVIHIDFEGAQHPADLTARPADVQ